MEKARTDQDSKSSADRLDITDAAFKGIFSYAHRMANLLNSQKAKASPGLIASLDDCLGAVYALIYAKQKGFRDRPNQGIEVSAVITRAEQVAKGEVRTDGMWMAGFHFNSALFRMSSTYDRFLKIVTGKGGNVGTLRILAEELYKRWTGESWKNENIRAIHGQVTDLKHNPEGIYASRRSDAGFQNAFLAIGELLDLVEAWK
jgi:hypothetical protein